MESVKGGKFMSFFRADRADSWVAGLLLGAFAVLVARGQGVLPSIMADEWHYSLLSRLLPFSQSDDPGFAYLGLYEATNLCAGGYLGCARLLNSLFFVGGSFLVFLAARLVLPPAISVGVLVLVLLAPESIYTVFFMPEAVYFFAFWMFAFVALRTIRRGVFSATEISMCGVLLAMASLVKPHALFLLACFAVFLLSFHGPSPRVRMRGRLRLVISAAATFLIVKFSLGFLAAGTPGITLFGTRYGAMASQNISAERLGELLLVSGQILLNHLSLMLFIFFVPIYGALKLLVARRGTEKLTSGVERNIAMLALALLLPMLGVTAAFSGSVAGTVPYEVAERMHMRYYSFIIPLLVIMAAWLALNDTPSPTPRSKTLAAAVCIPLFVLGVLRLAGVLGGLQINWVDSPGLMFLAADKWVRTGLSVLGICVAVLGLFNLKGAARLYLVLFLPVLFLVDAYLIQQTAEARKQPDVYDAAGMMLNGLLAGSITEQVTSFGPDEASLYRTSFYVDRPNTAIRVVGPGQAVDPTLVPPEATRVLVFGEGQMDKPGFELAIDQGFKLYTLRNQSGHLSKLP